MSWLPPGQTSEFHYYHLLLFTYFINSNKDIQTDANVTMIIIIILQVEMVTLKELQRKIIYLEGIEQHYSA